MRPLDRAIMLLLRAECLSGEARVAKRAGDEANAARMGMEMLAATVEAREIIERMLAQ